MFFCTHRGLQLKVTFGDSGSNIELALSIPYQIFLWKPINFKKNFWNWNFWIADRWNYCQVESFQLFSGKFEQHPLQKLGLNWIKIDFLIYFFRKICDCTWARSHHIHCSDYLTESICSVYCAIDHTGIISGLLSSCLLARHEQTKFSSKEQYPTNCFLLNQ